MAGDKSSTRFDNMSDQELRDYIGGDIDPNLSRSDLITMAVQSDAIQRGRDKGAM